MRIRYQVYCSTRIAGTPNKRGMPNPFPTFEAARVFAEEWYRKRNRRRQHNEDDVFILEEEWGDLWNLWTTPCYHWMIVE